MPEHDATPIGPVLLVVQIVSIKLLPLTGAILLHVATGVAAVVFTEVLGSGQVNVTHEFPLVAVTGEQEATGTLL